MDNESLLFLWNFLLTVRGFVRRVCATDLGTEIYVWFVVISVKMNNIFHKIKKWACLKRTQETQIFANQKKQINFVYI